MKTLINHQQYDASVILEYILNIESDECLQNGVLCNAIRLCIGKKPYKNSSEYYRDSSKFDFLNEKNAANDVY